MNSEKASLLRLPRATPRVPVIGAPQWLKDRMERVRQFAREHPPTLEEVRIQFQASANQRDSIQRELDDKIAKGIPIR